MVKEHLDRFLVSTSWLCKVPFLSSEVVRRASSDHDAIILDTMGRKPKKTQTDLRLFFLFEECWARDTEAKNIVNDTWCNIDGASWIK